jgi:Sulfotransferase family
VLGATANSDGKKVKSLNDQQNASLMESGASASLASSPARAGSKRDFEIVLHVGHPKTATTWLQAMIFENPETGFVVPWSDARARAIAAFVTVNPYQRQATWARSFFGQELERLADDPRVPVLSDETLCGDPFQRLYHGSDVANRIYQVFPRAKILIGIREQKAIAISSYREYIFLGGTFSLTEFIGTGQEPLSYTPILREDFLAYDLVVSYYQELYGRGNVLVLPIEQLQRNRSGFVQTILDFCGCPGRLTVEAEPAHTGWSAIALAARRVLNPLIPTSPLSLGHRQLRNRVANRLCGALNHLPQRWSVATEQRWKDQVSRRYAGAFGTSNRRLAELTGLDLAALGYDLN